jgi:short subunit fatty acids transporter
MCVIVDALNHSSLSHPPISVFDEVNAIEFTGVAVLGLTSNCVELVLRSVGDQHVSEATVLVRANRQIRRDLPLGNEMPPIVSLLDRKRLC